jgi:perosamine synthetase
METISWWKVQSTGYEESFLKKCIDSSYFNEGDLADQLEQSIREEIKAKYAIVCSSGTAALFLALKSVGVKMGDLVAVPSTTFIATANAVKLAGATPIFIDCDVERLTMEHTDLEKAILEFDIKFLILVHVSGRSAFNSELNLLISKYNLKVIEDAAEAFGSKDPTSGNFLGTIGDVGIYSFSPNKIVTSGQGGAVVTNSQTVAEICIAMKDQGRPIRGTGGADLHPLEGYNFKVSDVNCAIALGQLVKLQERLQHLRSVYTFYEQGLSKCPHQMLLPFNIKKGEVPLWPDFWTDEREDILNKFQKNKIGYREIWLPVNDQPEFLGGRSTINSERISKCVFWLPSAFNLDQNMLQHIISTLKCQHCRS